MAEKLRQKAEKIINDLFPDFAINENNYYGKAKFCKTLVEFANETTKELEVQIEKIINEIDKTMVLSNMRECEICDIQDIFRKYGFKRNNNNTWEIKEND